MNKVCGFGMIIIKIIFRNIFRLSGYFMIGNFPGDKLKLVKPFRTISHESLLWTAKAVIMQMFLPSDPLKPFIRNYLIIESQGGSLNRVLPEKSVAVAFRYRGQVGSSEQGNHTDFPPVMISGFRKAGRQIVYSRDSGNLLVFFRETGAVAFIREPLHLLFGQSIPLDCLTGFRDLSEVTGRLCEAACHKERILVVERFLMGRLILPKPDLAITEALLRIRMAKGNLRISDLSDSLCTSIDPFEKKFRKIVGLTPKQYAWIIRIHSVINSRPWTGKIAEAALEAGFFDQAHFNRDFKLFTGLTPREFQQFPFAWKNQ